MNRQAAVDKCDDLSSFDVMIFIVFAVFVFVPRLFLRLGSEPLGPHFHRGL